MTFSSRIRSLLLGAIAVPAFLGALQFAAAATIPGAANTETFGFSGATTLTVPTDSITGSTSVQKQGAFTLICGQGFGSTLSTASFYPCFKDGVLYKVSTGNTCHVLSATTSSSTTNTGYQLETRTDAPPVGGSSASGTGAVFQQGATALYPNVTGQSKAWLTEGFEWTAASATYLQIQPDSNAGYIVKLHCIETNP